MIPIKPMLASSIKDLSLLTFPLILQPKIDGIRCIMHPTKGPVTRSLKPIRNTYIRESLLRFRDQLLWLDGELVVVDPKTLDAASISPFNLTSSGVMSVAGKPHFKYIVFDHFGVTTDVYQRRMRAFSRASAIIVNDYMNAKNINCEVVIIDSHSVNTVAEVQVLEDYYLRQGYEGVMLKDPFGVYKYGRSTLKEGYSMKLKRMSEAEGTIVSCIPYQTNLAERFFDLLGYSKKPRLKAELRDEDLLGALEVMGDVGGEFANLTFKLGTGFDMKQREDLWKIRDELIGKRVTFHYQPTGILNKPRFPVFKCIREDI